MLAKKSPIKNTMGIGYFCFFLKTRRAGLNFFIDLTSSVQDAKKRQSNDGSKHLTETAILYLIKYRRGRI